MTQKNKIVIRYVQEKYKTDLNEVCEGKQDLIALTGFLLAINEKYASKSSNVSIMNNQYSSFGNQTVLSAPLPKWGQCAIAALTGIHSIDMLISGYELLSATEILSFVKGIAKRYLGWIGVGVAIYEFSECMDWI